MSENLPRCTCSSHCLQVEGCQCERGKVKVRIAKAEQAVVEAAMALTLTAHEMGVLDPVTHIAVGMDLRQYAAKEHAVFDACAALAKLRQGEGA